MNISPDKTVCRHEAGHCAASIMLRHRIPLELTADRPEAGVAGQTRLDLREDGVNPDTAEDFMVVAMAGPIAGDLGSSLPEWPLDPESRISDDRYLAALGGYLRLDETGYREVVDRAFLLVAEPDFVHLLRVVSYALERLAELDQEQIRFVIGPDLSRRYIDSDQPERTADAA